MRNHYRAGAAAVAMVMLALAAPAGAADPVGTSLCSGVRPGAVINPNSSFYTMAFLFRDQYGARYVSTVGNFVLSSPGTKVWKVNTGPTTYDNANKKFGRFVYAKWTGGTGDTNFDTFGLIRLNRGVRYSAQVCHFGGPTGISSGTTSNPVQLGYYGQGLPFVFSVPARTAVATNMLDKGIVFGAGLTDGFGLGDEGAPVVYNGRALGIYIGGVGFNGTTPPSGGNFLVTRLPKWISAAQKALKVKLYILTAKAR